MNNIMNNIKSLVPLLPAWLNYDSVRYFLLGLVLLLGYELKRQFFDPTIHRRLLRVRKRQLVQDLSDAQSAQARLAAMYLALDWMLRHSHRAHEVPSPPTG